MSFAHVLQHESLVTSFDWEEDDDSEDVLFSMNVSPVLFRSTGVWGTNTGRAAMIPMTMVSQMFEHWRGSIILAFRLLLLISTKVVSELHMILMQLVCSVLLNIMLLIIGLLIWLRKEILR
jgi:hypothetical protein